MAENAFITIVNGLRILKKHPVLFVPSVIYYFATIVLGVSFILLLLDFEKFGFGTLLYVLIGFLVLIFFIYSFVNAGSIGMAKEAVESGSTNFKYLFSYGKKYSFRLMAATIFIMLIRSVSAIFWKPVLNKFGGLEYDADYVIDALNNDPSLLLPMFETLAVPVLIAVFASAIYLILVSFMFFFVSYIIVIDDLSVFKSYRKSFKLLRTRPIRIISFIFLITVIQSLTTFISILFTAALNYFGFPSFIGLAVHLILLIFTAAALNIWVTRFYIILTKKETAAIC
ncbi:hypothetical protein MmiHf6_03230 [Methanimicrococcus hongohii]|uniref:DUF7847 domain-containing protein n=1 Tax=Methanimicrococcus hongohii TaxID=3028295 RepID=A0AA96V9M8_9EURY|nr:hypothetical protein [Methanimicrococcus sp. Hf6]WNY23027.1 hypothetical protein MmiHf6_03230 [Methanimicrococcus sp. Hf6]